MSKFSGKCNLVTLGKGLVELSNATEKFYRALLPPDKFIKVDVSRVGYYPSVKVNIHTEDDKGQDISIICSTDTVFYLEDGNLCSVNKLRGKRLMSIGRNNTYCIEINSSIGEEFMYRIGKMERTEIEWVYINGIKVKI